MELPREKLFSIAEHRCLIQRNSVIHWDDDPFTTKDMEATTSAKRAKEASHRKSTSQPIASESWGQSAISGQKRNVGTWQVIYRARVARLHRTETAATTGTLFPSTTRLPTTAFSARGIIHLQPFPLDIAPSPFFSLPA